MRKHHVCNPHGRYPTVQSHTITHSNNVHTFILLLFVRFYFNSCILLTSHYWRLLKRATNSVVRPFSLSLSFLPFDFLSLSQFLSSPSFPPPPFSLLLFMLFQEYTDEIFDNVEAELLSLMGNDSARMFASSDALSTLIRGCIHTTLMIKCGPTHIHQLNNALHPSLTHDSKVDHTIALISFTPSRLHCLSSSHSLFLPQNSRAETTLFCGVTETKQPKPHVARHSHLSHNTM